MNTLKASYVCVGPEVISGQTFYHCCEGDKMGYDYSQSKWLCDELPLPYLSASLEQFPSGDSEEDCTVQPMPPGSKKTIRTKKR